MHGHKQLLVLILQSCDMMQLDVENNVKKTTMEYDVYIYFMNQFVQGDHFLITSH